MPNGPVRFGLHSGQQYASFDELRELWRRAEELGFDWVSLFDHFRPPLSGKTGPCLEGTTALSALSALTSRVRCAMLVSSVTWRHPAQLALIAATIDHVSGGRLELGLGAGGPDLAYAEYGIDFPSAAERVELLDEACHVLRSLWSNTSTTFDGKHLRLSDARLEPKPVQARLPLVIGGAGPRLLRVVAEHADTWNSLAGDLPRYLSTVDTLRERCADIGRDPAEIRQSVTFRVVLGADDAEVDKRVRERMAVLPDADLSEYVTFGTPEQCVADLLPYAEAGVRDFLLGARPPVDWRTIELFSTQVAPVLRHHLDG
ncbi:Coenzyme F420-dependent N5 N10-methylene tetrahydromethanopterin reductase and related flavin-dependent oxidoreductase-like protein [Alloactinosynnema sp. L-07]|uniref:LLM class flavin-dependent oxidoreductase n=1 Tax=Alloactinosynnema sp. L-07 TaxID=1653480 RepID=UPI00065F0459|nr:LLM class flavin-dependent oxidoreductase [Alloactinosynnema sp. L-07]CRK61870.1 Coenzyme F420-dependent N5 N10-methylene tetrahydromethanopterin reductase and related flavin-dependent oxidoreductase-like protein [Alloactinosynnema sp. L-07]